MPNNKAVIPYSAYILHHNYLLKYEKPANKMGTHTLISSDDVRKCSFNLGKKLIETKFYPDIIYSILRGGIFIGLPIHEFYTHNGHKAKYGVIHAKSYTAPGRQSKVKVKDYFPLLDTVKRSDRILIADDIIDSGNTIEKIISDIESNTCLRYKKKPCIKDQQIVIVSHDIKEPKIMPDLYCHQWPKDAWLIYLSHELEGLTKEEIALYHGI